MDALPLVLGIDCALGGLSVSLVRGDCEIAGFADPTLADQAARLLPIVEQVLAESCTAYGDLAGVAVTIGPGGFTGVRIGLAAARGLAFAAGLPIRGVTTLELLAETAGGPCLAVLPAGRDAFYVQAFPGDEPPSLVPSDRLQALAAGRTLAATEGPWLDLLPRDAVVVRHDVSANARLAARLAFRRGFTAPLPEVTPLYIRPPDAKPQASLIVDANRMPR